MKLFKCDDCGQLIYFENSVCIKCGHSLGFAPHDLTLHTLKPAANQTFNLVNDTKNLYKYCKNFEYDNCNWLVPANGPNAYCVSCELNNTIPNLSYPEHVKRWRLIENAKRRLMYTLYQLKLPVISKTKDKIKGLSFDFLTEDSNMVKVCTGHENGLITLNIAEADDDKRELLRKQMNELYRTLLGHFRHEIGHYYWDRLIEKSTYLNKFRQLFGDERIDYDQALQRHYNQGIPPDWQMNYISAYASSHPWEDWAETWAHYLHIVDTLETADSFGIKVAPRLADRNNDLNASIRINPYDHQDFENIINLWRPLTLAMNSLNRSMGNHDLYPFVIPQRVIQKLSFIHEVCYASRVA